jgi:hypothetical protein
VRPPDCVQHPVQVVLSLATSCRELQRAITQQLNAFVLNNPKFVPSVEGDSCPRIDRLPPELLSHIFDPSTTAHSGYEGWIAHSLFWAKPLKPKSTEDDGSVGTGKKEQVHAGQCSPSSKSAFRITVSLVVISKVCALSK